MSSTWAGNKLTSELPPGQWHSIARNGSETLPTRFSSFFSTIHHHPFYKTEPQEPTSPRSFSNEFFICCVLVSYVSLSLQIKFWARIELNKCAKSSHQVSLYNSFCVDGWPLGVPFIPFSSLFWLRESEFTFCGSHFRGSILFGQRSPRKGQFTFRLLDLKRRGGKLNKSHGLMRFLEGSWWWI